MKFLSSMWFLTILALGVAIGTVFFRVYTAATTPVELPETMHDVKVDGAAVAALWNTQTGYIDELSNELKNSMHELKSREDSLNKESDRLKNEMRELKRLQEEIQNIRQQLTDTILTIEAAEVKNLRSQATIYSNMDPASAIQVFNEMDDVEVVKILYFMESDIQSEIFQAMVQDNTQPEVIPGVKLLSGPQRVAKLNEMLKFTLPPAKKK